MIARLKRAGGRTAGALALLLSLCFHFKIRTPPVSRIVSTAPTGRCHDRITPVSITFNETLNDFLNNATFNLHFEWQKHKNSPVNQFIIEGRTTKPEFL
jgi:hypothetical protein